MKLEDMRLFARVAEMGSFSAAARNLGLPKQTLSRRIAELERALDVQLLHRTTRRVRLTEIGAAYAERCAEIVRLAEDANRAVTDAGLEPRGTLRVTADPVFGENFLTPLVVDYARQYPHVHLDVVLTRRQVDLIEEGFDLAFRVGQVDDPALSATCLGPATIRYCASPAYVARHGVPLTPGALEDHECIAVVADGSPVRWPLRGPRGTVGMPVKGRLRLNSFAMAHAAALGGLGIAIFPEFACAADLRTGRLVSVLDDFVPDVGSVWLLHPRARYLAARVRSFVTLALARLADRPPWVLGREDAPEPAPSRRKTRRAASPRS